MSWVPVAQNEDVPPGTRVMFVYRLEVPGWLQWIPSQILDFINTNILKAWAAIKQRFCTDFEWVGSPEVSVVEPGKVYQVRFYAIAKGAIPWAAALAIVAIISATLIILTIKLEGAFKWVASTVQQLIPPPPFSWVIGAAIGIGISAALIGFGVSRLRGRK